MLLILLLCIFENVRSLDLIGWYIRDSGCGDKMNYSNFPFEYYTHVVTSSPVVLDNGMAVCDNDLFLQNFVTRAHSLGRRVMWRDGMPAESLRNVILNDSWSVYKNNYLISINDAVVECNVDGIEFDYEPAIGLVSHDDSIRYANFLLSIKTALGSTKQIGANMGVWGLTQGSFPIMIRPWIDVKMVNNGAVDYINTMSYHWPFFGGIFPWIKDAIIYTNIWGFNPNKINIGLPYYNFNGTYNEPLWCNLSDGCPNIDPSKTKCQGIRIVSKQQNYRIGQYIKHHGFRGLLPWAANYDSLTDNNSMVNWLYAGMTD